ALEHGDPADAARGPGSDFKSFDILVRYFESTMVTVPGGLSTGAQADRVSSRRQVPDCEIALCICLAIFVYPVIEGCSILQTREVLLTGKGHVRERPAGIVYYSPGRHISL